MTELPNEIPLLLHTRPRSATTTWALAIAMFAAFVAPGAALAADESVTPGEVTSAPASEPSPAQLPPPPQSEIASAAASASPPPPAPPPPYSLPWQLRPVTVGNVVRSDTSVAFYQDAAGNAGNTEVTMLLATYRVLPELAPLVRLGLVKNNAPGVGVDGTAFVNPIVGATYARKLGNLRLAGFLATTIPIGQGAGDSPNAGAATADAAAIRARSGMDNAMFAVNYMTGIVGLGLAFVHGGFTAQAEATVLQLFRVRGDNAASATDATRTNATAGLHLGYFVIPQLSLGGEIRYQRWLSQVTQRNGTGASVPIADFAKDTATFAVGPRGHFKLGTSIWLRPGISYAQGLDKPLTDGKYHVVQVDLPVSF